MSWNSGWLPSGVRLPRRVALGGGVRRRRAGTRTRTPTSSPRVAREKGNPIMSDMTWPDTVGQDPPADHLYLSATWLLGRYPQLARLVERVPGVVEIGEDGVGVDVGVLAEAIAGQARSAAEWLEYRSTHQPPEEEGEAYIAWEAGGPPTSAGAEAVNAMSHPERTWLRLLATFAATGVTLTVADLQSLDAVGHEFLADWCSAVQTV